MTKGTVLITGAGKRVGLHLAHYFHQHGYAVIAHYHSESPAIAELMQLGVHCIAADFCDKATIANLIDEVKGHCAARDNSLRAIVHNASAFEKTDDDLQCAIKQMEQFFSVHAVAAYWLSTALAPLLQACANEHADIVQISDIYADNPNPAFDVYCASKAAAQNLALSLAKKYAPKIKVNVIQPGPILFKDWHSDAVKQAVLNETLLKKEGGVDAIAWAVMAVLNNPYQTGSVIAVDGGRRLA